MDLIDREVYRRQIKKSLDLMSKAGESQSDVAHGMMRDLRLLDMQDEIDAVPVVRCGDCVYCEKVECIITGAVICCCTYGFINFGTDALGFCYHGKRREEK